MWKSWRKEDGFAEKKASLVAGLRPYGWNDGNSREMDMGCETGSVVQTSVVLEDVKGAKGSGVWWGRCHQRAQV